MAVCRRQVVVVPLAAQLCRPPRPFSRAVRSAPSGLVLANPSYFGSPLHHAMCLLGLAFLSYVNVHKVGCSS